MELVLNIAWMAVVISLWGIWLVGRRKGRGRSLRCTLVAETIALALMTAFLLPAISITDDLHACQIPAEIKRSEVQNDRHLVPVTPAKNLPLAMALLVFWTLPSPARWSHFVGMDPLVPPATRGRFRALFSRPPPAAV